MVTEIRYTTINRVIDDLMDHPMLTDLSLEQVVRYTLRFISKHGYPRLYEDKIETVEIHQFRGLLPCDLISINQVKDTRTHICLRDMTDNFPKGMRDKNPHHTIMKHREELSFKTQGRVIYTSFPEGKVEISYKSIPVDENNFPLLIDNETYLDALEAYIKVKVFTVKYDQQKISAGVLQNAQTDYAVAARLLESEFTTPSVSEMESISRMWNTLIPQVRRFTDGFKRLGDREYLRRH